MSLGTLWLYMVVQLQYVAPINWAAFQVKWLGPQGCFESNYASLVTDEILEPFNILTCLLRTPYTV
jgi:hypothetical protein